MLNVDKFVVNGYVIKNPKSSQVYKVLDRIFENTDLFVIKETNSLDVFELTKAVASTLPKEKSLSFWPHVEPKEPLYFYHIDTAYIFNNENLKSLGTDILTILAKKIDTCINRKTIRKQDKQDIISILKYLFEKKDNFGTPLGQGHDREKGLGMTTKVYNAGKYAIKTIYNQNYYHLCTPNFDNIKLTQQRYPKLKTYKGTVLLRTDNLKFMENVGEHKQAGLNSFSTYLNKEEEISYYKNNYLKQFSQVPQESFDEIALDFATLNIEYSKDGIYTLFAFENPNNIILKDGKLYLVDELVQNCTVPNTTAYYLCNMLGTINQFNEMSHIIDYGDAMPFAKIIFEKILKSSAAAKLPVTANNGYCTHALKDILSNLKIKASVESVVDELERINKISDKNERITAIEKYTRELFKNEY